MRYFVCLSIAVYFSIPAISQADTLIRRIPPQGIAIKQADSLLLQEKLDSLSAEIDQLKKKKNDRLVNNYLADVLIYQKAVDYALHYNEFFSDNDVIAAKAEVEEGLGRARSLNNGKAPWTRQTGEVIRGYISSIDGSAQPYGLSIPAHYFEDSSDFNLSFWFHGRGEKMSEVSFIANSNSFMRTMPPMQNTIMLYPYGRYCNAFKFAGETDIWEALTSAKKNYHFDTNSVLIRGFSMGGAAAWQMAVHFPDHWLAANPGAGFSETVQFLKIYHEFLHPNWYEKALWHLYDCTDYAANLFELPLVVYSGEADAQMQAASMMDSALKAEGLSMKHIIGKKMGHAYDSLSAQLIDSYLDSLIQEKKRPVPRILHFTTYTLKYNKMYWVSIDALKSHWVKARIDVAIVNNQININTSNINTLSLDLNAINKWKNKSRPWDILIDNSHVYLSIPATQKKLTLTRSNGWKIAGSAPALRKQHDLQGPIDDAFMSAFIVVKPTGKSNHPMVESWCRSEFERFLVQWRRQFRGDAIVKADTAITNADLSKNLIIFGDPASNHFLSSIASKLPISWNNQQILLGKTRYSSESTALIMIYPNPKNPKHYIVLNSGFTFREDAFLNNAKQIPMLPDWAIVDLQTPPGNVYPGKILDAGFFGEKWELLTPAPHELDQQ